MSSSASTPIFQKDLYEFVRLLNIHGVEYVVVGAYAMAFHNVPRFTGDVDIFINRSEANASKLIDAIVDFGFAELGLEASDFIGQGVVQLGVAPNRIDLLSALTGVSFDEVWKERELFQAGDLFVNVIGKRLLIQNKRRTGRPKDLADVVALER